MRKTRRIIRFRFGSWVRTRSRGGVRYFHNGRFTSEKKFSRANLRRKQKNLVLREEVNLCRVRDRKSLYNEIIKDLDQLHKKLGAEKYSKIRVIANIGMKYKRHQKDVDNLGRGHRTFFDMTRFKKFLDFSDAEYGNAPDWSRQGLCRYDKKFYLMEYKTVGNRITGEKIIKSYAIKQP